MILTACRFWNGCDYSILAFSNMIAKPEPGSSSTNAMESKKEANSSATARDGAYGRSVVVELPLGESAATFDLEKAVCSHGLFMMAPNHWDPHSKVFQRPLRLIDDDDEITAGASSSFIVRISQHSHSRHCLRLRVFGTDALSPRQQQLLLDQVRRMLRLSEGEEKNLRGFWEVDEEAKKKGFGRVFRSPTLFEDMVKCILLCNCQWPRTLAMAKALCELQLELQSSSSSVSVIAVSGTDMFSKSTSAETELFIPKTPATKESKKNHRIHRSVKKLKDVFSERTEENDEVAEVEINHVEGLDGSHEAQTSGSSLSLPNKKDDVGLCVPASYSLALCKDKAFLDSHIPVETNFYTTCNEIGNFPTPSELASLDESYMAKRCSLGYRAGRILNLAQNITEGRIQLKQLEEACSSPSTSSYNTLAELLNKIDGFGPFTCANVLMCMGFYDVIPTDSETIRHLKQVHKRNSSIQTVSRNVQVIYEKYAPFQFLAYWSEVWHFYEERFGKLSEMPHSDYKLITATNMKRKTKGGNKRIKISVTS